MKDVFRIGRKALPVEIGDCRESSLAEMARLGNTASPICLARYRGQLYGISTGKPPLYHLTEGLRRIQDVSLREVEALYAGVFSVRYRGIWYDCMLIGAMDGRVSTIVRDPQNTTGLASPNSHYMWGDGVELSHEQIEAVRLWLSGPIDPALAEET